MKLFIFQSYIVYPLSGSTSAASQRLAGLRFHSVVLRAYDMAGLLTEPLSEPRD